MPQALIISPQELTDRIGTMSGPRGAAAGAWTRLGQFLRLADEEGFDLSDAAAVVDGRAGLIWACLAIRSPGRTSLLLLGPMPDRTDPDQSEAVRLLVEQEAARGAALVQALLPPAQQAEARLLRDCGFTHLADLIYMRTDLSSALSATGGARDGWPARPDEAVAPYDESARPRFARVIQDSYVGTRDCPGLEGIRRIDDVLAGHQGSGVFRPDLWFMYSSDGGDVGVVLLNELSEPGTRSVELVYMGLVASARGRGLGRRMLGHALLSARAAGFARMILAVDSANEPAMRLYRRLGFAETMRRAAWIVAPRPPAAPGGDVP